MTFLKYLLTKAFLKQLLYAFLVLIILSFIILWWLRSTTNHNQKIEVPNLAKLSLDIVEDQLDELDLRYEILDSANYNPDYPRYSVIEQIPKAGQFVKENRKIYLTLNPSDYRKIKVPEVLGKTGRQSPQGPRHSLEACGPSDRGGSGQTRRQHGVCPGRKWRVHRWPGGCPDH